MLPRFSPDTIRFLKALKRNNDREWFKARKDRYERSVRAPMIAVIEALARDFKRFAPELVASPRASLYRIYRDTRFSADKSPLKAHAAAVFPWRGLQRHEGAGLYFEIAPGWVWAGGGMYAPQPPQLLRVRTHIAETWPEIQSIVRRAAFARQVGALDGERTSRVPRGFAADDPAAEFLKHRQFLAGREFAVELSFSEEFYPALLATFRAVAPLVRFLNQPLAGAPREAPLRATP